MGQYDWLFYKYPKEETHADGMLPPVQAYFRGEFSVPGSQVYLPYRAYLKPGIISKEPHFHRDEEYLAIVGHDLRDAFESFDAEVVLYMGESPDAMEKIVIDRPAMVRVPKYYWHGPIEITRLGKPLFFQPVEKLSGLFRSDKQGCAIRSTELLCFSDSSFYIRLIIEKCDCLGTVALSALFLHQYTEYSLKSDRKSNRRNLIFDKLADQIVISASPRYGRAEINRLYLKDSPCIISLSSDQGHIILCRILSICQPIRCLNHIAESFYIIRTGAQGPDLLKRKRGICKQTHKVPDHSRIDLLVLKFFLHTLRPYF